MTTMGTLRWAAAVLALCASPALAQVRTVERVAAIVNDDMIAMSEVYERAAPEMMRLDQDGVGTPEKKKDALKHALDELIADRLLQAEERSLGVEVTEQEVDYAIDDVRKQNGMDAATFERALSSQGASLSAYREKMKKDLAAMKLIGMKVRSKIKVSDEDVKAEYQRRARLEEADVEVHARHIVIQVPKDGDAAAVEKARERAAELAKRARAGEDFGELAKKYSEGPSKVDGGDVGFFKRGEMVAAFDQVAFSLKPNEVSDPVRSPFGWHVIQVLERRAGKSRPYEAVKDEIRDRLTREQMQRQTEQYVEELRKQAVVDVKVPELK